MNMGTFEPHSSRNSFPWLRCFEANDSTVVDRIDCGGSIPFVGLLKPPENAEEEAEDAPRVARGGGETAEKQAQIVAIGRLHGARRVAGGGHSFFDHSGEQVEIAGGGGGAEAP